MSKETWDEIKERDTAIGRGDAAERARLSKELKKMARDDRRRHALKGLDESLSSKDRWGLNS